MTPGEIIRKYEPAPENLLTILHDLQDAHELHYLTESNLRLASEYLALNFGFVHGVATFYTMFSLEPRGKNIIRVCQSPPCHLMGSTTIVRELRGLLGVDLGQTTPDHLFTLEMSSCLGVCGVAPAMMINNEVYGNLTPEKIREVVKEKGRVP
jgi:NADH-quinone oxidoreductase subunit E